MKLFFAFATLLLLQSCATNTFSPQQREEVRQVIRSNMPKFKNCYEKTLVKFPDAKGKVIVRFEVIDDGTVRSSKVDEEKSKWEEKPESFNMLGDCMNSELKQIRFATADKDVVRVIDYPFVFGSR